MAALAHHRQEAARAAFAPAGRNHSALLQSGQPTAAVTNAAQLGGQAEPLRLGDVVLLYAQDRRSYVFSDVSRYGQLEISYWQDRSASSLAA